MGNYNVIDPELGEFNEHQAPSDHLIILWTSSMLACGFTEVPCNVWKTSSSLASNSNVFFSPRFRLASLPPFFLIHLLPPKRIHNSCSSYNHILWTSAIRDQFNSDLYVLRAEEQSSDFRGRKIVTAGRASVLGSSSDEVQTHGYLGYLNGLMKQLRTTLCIRIANPKRSWVGS